MYGCMNVCMYVWMNEWMIECMHDRMHACMNECMNAWINKSINQSINQWCGHRALLSLSLSLSLSRCILSNQSPQEKYTRRNHQPSNYERFLWSYTKSATPVPKIRSQVGPVFLKVGVPSINSWFSMASIDDFLPFQRICPEPWRAPICWGRHSPSFSRGSAIFWWHDIPIPWLMASQDYQRIEVTLLKFIQMPSLGTSW